MKLSIILAISALICFPFDLLATKSQKEVAVGLLLYSNRKNINKPKRKLVERAIKMALEDNEKRLADHGLRVIVKKYVIDDDLIKVAELIKKVIQEESIAGIGLDDSSFAAIGGPVLTGSDYMLVSPYATASTLLKYSPNLLLLSATNTDLSKAMASFINDEFKHHKLSAIVSWNCVYCKDIYNNLPSSLKQNISLFKILDFMYDPPSIASKVLASSPELILLPNFTQVNATIINELLVQGFRGKFVGADSWGENATNDFFQAIKNTDFQGYTVRQYYNRQLPPKAEKIKKRLEPSNPNMFDVTSLLYYDSMNFVLTKLIEIANTPNRKQFMKAVLNQTNYQGLFGNVCFTKNTCQSKIFYTLDVSKKGFLFYKKINLN